MKKHFVFIALILCVAFALFGVSVNNTAGAMSQVPKNTEIQEETYVLSDYHGRIALFQKDNPTPIKVYRVFTQSLPQNDCELIKSGIEIKYGDVNKIIEEYTS